VDLWFWIWAILAVLLLGAEIFTAGFFMLPFGIGAAVAATLALFGVPLAWQWFSFVCVSTLAFVLLKRFANRITREQPIKTGAERLIGMTGVVTEDITSNSAAGKVRVDRETWRADAPGSETVPAGTEVIVERVGGAHLVVRVKDAS